MVRAFQCTIVIGISCIYISINRRGYLYVYRRVDENGPRTTMTESCFKETFQHLNCLGKLVFQYMPQIKHFNLGRGVLVKNRLPVSVVPGTNNHPGRDGLGPK